MTGGNRMKVSDIRLEFAKKYTASDITVDAKGNKTYEILGASFIADEPFIFGEVNHEYVNAEIKWYESESLNINDIYNGVKPPPKAWTLSADKYGNINSNYGHLIFSKKYWNQYQNALVELKNNPSSRRATMIYTRPSIWNEYNENGKSDFICTNAVTYYIRNDALHAVVQMRSNDVVYGYRNDYAFQMYILNAMSEVLNVPVGTLHWQVQSLHVYEKHFKLVEQFVMEKL